jgi:hypothetical protein
MKTQNNAKKHNFDRESIIMALVKMRVEKFATTKTMIDFLQNDLGYATSYTYELIRECKKRIQDIFKEEFDESFSNSMARLEEIIESTKNEKLRLEAQKELNKLLGLYRPTNIEVKHSGEIGIQGIDIKIITNKDDITKEDL